MSSFTKFVGVASTFSKTNRNDDFTDRLNHRVTPAILAACVILTSLYQYTGKPVTCWAPKHFTDIWITYANDYCWVKNTYYIPFNNEIPKDQEAHLRHDLRYYQWIPFILICQGILFYVPRLIWQGFNQKGGVDCDQVMQAAMKYQKTREEAERQKNLKAITLQIGRFVWFNKPGAEGGVVGRCKHLLECVSCGICGPRLRCYLVMLYLMTKVLFLANILFQLFILDHIFQTSYSRIGFTALDHLVKNGTLTVEKPVFPKITFCDFRIRRLGNVHRYTLQCVLPVNLFTEKIYILMWFWFIIVFILTACSFISWFLQSFLGMDREKYIRNHLNGLDQDKDKVTDENVRRFTYDYLQRDGSFLLRLIHHNTNNLTINDIIESLWKAWVNKKTDAKTPDDNDDDDDESPDKPLLNTDQDHRPSAGLKPPPDISRDSGLDLGYPEDDFKKPIRLDDVDAVQPSAPPVQDENGSPPYTKDPIPGLTPVPEDSETIQDKKPDIQKPDDLKLDIQKPDDLKPDIKKPDDLKLDIQKPDDQKPDGEKPDDKKAPDNLTPVAGDQKDTQPSVKPDSV